MPTARFRIGEPLPRADRAHTSRDKWRRWILAERGHGGNWAHVFHAGRSQTAQIWLAITRQVCDAPVTTIRAIVAYDLVELTEAIDDAPAGASGGVLELMDDATAMVEVTTPPLDGAERIVFAPVSTLRRVS